MDDVAKWDFTTIAPSHFAARPGTPHDLRAAFAPTLAAPSGGARPYAVADVRLLEDIGDVLVKFKVI